MTQAPHLVVMGVSGTGKTSVGRELARRLQRGFVEGDEHHPQASIDKMAAGDPLDDEDREPWLVRLTELLTAADEPLVLTCSALRRSYRDVLRGSKREVFFVHLHADFEVLEHRMMQRAGHFMSATLLGSQVDTLEPLGEGEAGALVDVNAPLEEVVTRALEATPGFEGAHRGGLD